MSHGFRHQTKLAEQAKNVPPWLQNRSLGLPKHFAQHFAELPCSSTQEKKLLRRTTQKCFAELLRRTPRRLLGTQSAVPSLLAQTKPTKSTNTRWASKETATGFDLGVILTRQPALHPVPVAANASSLLQQRACLKTQLDDPLKDIPGRSPLYKGNDTSTEAPAILYLLLRNGISRLRKLEQPFPTACMSGVSE